MKTEYFTHISHEIRTPIAGVISIAELLLGDPLLQSEHRLLVSQALRSGEILLELVGMVLDLRKIESGELELERASFRTADLIQDAQLLFVLVKQKVWAYNSCCSAKVADDDVLRRMMCSVHAGCGVHRGCRRASPRPAAR